MHSLQSIVELLTTTCWCTAMQLCVCTNSQSVLVQA